MAKAKKKRNLNPTGLVNLLKDEQIKVMNQACVLAKNPMQHAYWCGQAIGFEKAVDIVKRETGVI